MKDTSLLVQAAENILEYALGPEWRQSSELVDTPRRVAKYWGFMLKGHEVTNAEIAANHNKTFACSNDNLVVESRIPVFSTCEHHLALMYDMNVAIGYIPKGKVIGLSKLARIAQDCAHRLQLQERIADDICEVLRIILGTEDIMIVIEGKHSCMTARGVEAREAVTRTALCEGAFRTNSDLRREFYSMIGDNK